MKLYIIDAIGPFFSYYKNKNINWSKIPFKSLEKDDSLDKLKFLTIKNNFSIFIKKIKALGYNAISLDDVAHLVDFDFYFFQLKRKISQYQHEYKTLFQIAKKENIKIFLNSDIMFFNKQIKKYTKSKQEKIIELLKIACEKLFKQFSIDGIIFRIGESDGIDVKEEFLSRLTIKNPKQANLYLKELLSVFEQHNKYLIFRTWTVGAYKIGDLIWNKKTYDLVFKNINSKNLIVSMKYGDTDFYGNLKLNPLFFHGTLQKIIELQTRREREGFGLFPNYVGWEYEAYYKKIKNLKEMIGISVWCQTGGWTQQNDITFLHKSSIWNELNTFATIKIFKNEITADNAVYTFFKDKKYLKFLKVFTNIFKELLYVKGFSDKTLYFRRSRIPPLMWMFWDQIIINKFIINLHTNNTNLDLDLPKKKLKKMKNLGKELQIKDTDFYYDTFKIFILCRKILISGKNKNKINLIIKEYKEKYADYSYDFSINLLNKEYKWSKLLLKLFIRHQAKYRLIDNILLNKVFSYIIFLFISIFYKKSMPSFINKKAMPLSSLFK